MTSSLPPETQRAALALPLQWPSPALPNVLGKSVLPLPEACRDYVRKAYTRRANLVGASPVRPRTTFDTSPSSGRTSYHDSTTPSPQRPYAPTMVTSPSPGRSEGIYRCEPCRKSFVQEQTYLTHTKTSKHVQAVAQLNRNGPSKDSKGSAKSYTDLSDIAYDAIQTLKHLDKLRETAPEQVPTVLWNVSRVLWEHGCIRDAYIGLSHLAAAVTATVADPTVRALGCSARRALFAISVIFGQSAGPNNDDVHGYLCTEFGIDLQRILNKERVSKVESCA
ncbi:hypothetical protein IWQ60_008100 [Tieghemiomyces parasiticus]|uniref:C2H2-type domain-containing protein n=1 Tax=Tieghemiomyces parasiticus TaxID=78921 RepID=A0A9W7ZTT1_9FUNG|nr:hypothetical protein IWQ60_008100 [Tieghemiomyces parasiticus]